MRFCSRALPGADAPGLRLPHQSVWAYTKELQTRTSRDFLLANAKIKSGRLRSAYLIAADPRAWMAEQEKKDQEAALVGGVKSEEE